MADITKWASARAFVAHDHEGGRAFAQTFADIGTTGFFANRPPFVGPPDVFDLVKPRARGSCFYADPIGVFSNPGPVAI